MVHTSGTFFQKCQKYIFNISSYIQKTTPNPINTLKIKSCIQNTPNIPKRISTMTMQFHFFVYVAMQRGGGLLAWRRSGRLQKQHVNNNSFRKRIFTQIQVFKHMFTNTFSNHVLNNGLLYKPISPNEFLIQIHSARAAF